jgi:hypothetical protein
MIDEDIVLVQPEEVTTETKQYRDPIYKQWFKTKERSGFLSISPWLEANKFIVDIGEAGADGKLKGSTACYVDAITLSLYCKSVYDLTAKDLYPANAKNGVPTDEALTIYGGSKPSGKVVSRVFKIHHWQKGQEYDLSAFTWKCGHFEGRESASGAFMPDLNKPISVNSIKVNRLQMAEIAYRMNIHITAHASRNTDWTG